MTIWADEMILLYKKNLEGYKKQRARLNKKNPTDRLDLTQYNSIIEETEFVLKWLETGRDPNNYRGADKKNVYQHRSFQSMDFIPDITEQLEEGPKHLYMSPEEKIIMADIFAALSFRERHCYILHIGRQVSVAKIAQGLGVGKSTAQSYIERAKKKIAQRVS
ncbi:sigma factor-like helix-turn-helix DNA-binding protein [Planomicrobium sp. CPCC 101079]|uniref:sigma factor-like helix-turn-helix DNA-binding protein n=1 Tax=Planomicrobium sp. CPCC 101079 TaxID=2599618 RepID=UPI0011B7A537|nr:sigma factor-like helix-turn-helix DNA-binding protein [Planomicrobium sp. CPCC 101079]TWT04617.1 RNA polymerase subunit sigma-70 [Planomicrobium sp. CPCC 101079]